MPGMDGTGPRGMGPMTGGGRGLCNPMWRGFWGGANPWRGYGYGRYAWGTWPAWPFGWAQQGPGGPWSGYTGPGYGASPGEELDFLKDQASALGQHLDQIQKRIEEMEEAETPKKK